MRRIHGYILVKESNQGVPNLVVCAFDSETSLAEIMRERQRASVTPALMETLGKRIGSVLTDKAGAFHLTRDDLQFEGVESRPDLVLAVLAPEDIIDPKRPFALPPEQRLLYITTVPRADAGAEEAFVIRLQQAQLDAFQIVLMNISTDAQHRLAASAQLLADLETNAQVRDNLKSDLHPRLKAEYTKNVAFRKKVKDNVQLTALPHSVRDHPSILKDKADLPKAQKQMVKEGLKRMKDTYKPRLHLRLTLAQLRGMRASVNQNGEIKGKINTLKIADAMREMLGGVDIVRKDDPAPSAISAKALDARYSLPPKPATGKQKTKPGKPKTSPLKNSKRRRGRL